MLLLKTRVLQPRLLPCRARSIPLGVRTLTGGRVLRSYEEEKATLDELAEKIPEAEWPRVKKMRNIGISAHIDSGKTTFTERVLYYTGRIKAIHEVRGRDNVGAKMDSMALEREKGITIQSAATFCDWEKRNIYKDGEAEQYHFNLIDTPGHIDFTIEVERALRVLDGAVLVVCAVSGVQSQTITVDRQMRRYNVPRVTFINKMDRMGADPWRALEQLNAKLKMPAIAIQVPIGAEDKLEGVVDLINLRALYNKGKQGEIIEEGPIPEDLKSLVEEKRQLMIESLADVDDEIAEIFLEEKVPTPEQITAGIRRATIARKMTPVLMGSALANRGVQPVLDAVCDFLPNPAEVLNTGLEMGNEENKVSLIPSDKEPFVGLAFKLEEGRYGQLTYIRVYQGKLKKGMTVINAKTGNRVKLVRLARMHSDEMEDIESAGAGEICATFGIDCASGDTFTDGKANVTMSSMFVPEPVISLSITPKSGAGDTNFSKAINRFQKEDPTFKVKFDPESKETVISGMGELHLEIYVERMKREYNVECVTGKPQVAYRETITGSTGFEHTHKKQSGGAGQFAKVVGELSALSDFNQPNVFETQIVGGKIPEKFLAACQKAFEEACEKGPLTGHKVLGVKMLINDGQVHLVDSNELSFRMATLAAFKKGFQAAQPLLLEPMMEVAVTAPTEFQSAVIGLLNKRMAMISETEIGPDEFTIIAECSLNSMFGFATMLRAATQGKGEFSLEFRQYAPAPPHIQKEAIEEYQKQQKSANL